MNDCAVLHTLSAHPSFSSSFNILPVGPFIRISKIFFEEFLIACKVRQPHLRICGDQPLKLHYGANVFISSFMAHFADGSHNYTFNFLVSKRKINNMFRWPTQHKMNNPICLNTTNDDSNTAYYNISFSAYLHHAQMKIKI